MVVLHHGKRSAEELKEGAWKQKLKHRTWRNIVCSACFLIYPKTACPGVAPPTVVWSL